MILMTRGLPARIIPLVASAMILTGCGGGSDTAATSSASSSTSGSPSSTSSTAQVALSAANYVVAPSSTAHLTIYRIGSSTGSASVGYTTVDGTATAGADYAATSGTVTWEDGDQSPRNVSVTVMSRAGGKNFSFSLTSIDGAASFGAPSTATVDVRVGGASDTAVTLSWAAPTTNTNGSALTNLAGFDIYYGTSAGAMTNKVTIGTVGVLSYVISDLTAGTWYFEVFAVNANGVQSGPSSTVSTTI